MDLPHPDTISLDDVSRALIRDVSETARRVNEFRPLDKAIVQRIEEELLGERVYGSNAIEGNTIDLRETILILKSGILGAKKKREATEVRNLGQAIRTVTRWLDASEDCFITDKLVQAHAILLMDIDDSIAGRFRGPGVMIAGAKYQPPDESLVPQLVDQVLESVRESTWSEPIVLAAWVHWAIARVHPFMDGNGRMARLWQDLVLYRARLTCAIIRPEDRREYLNALAQADEGEFNPMVQMLAQRISLAFDKYIVELRKQGEYDAFVKDLAGEADARIEEERRLAYMRWSRKMELLRTEFQLCAARLSESSKEIQIQVKAYDLIDQTRWENIRSGIGAEQTWQFRLDLSRTGRMARYYFFFEKHYWRHSLDTDSDRREQRVSLLISEDDGRGTGVHLDQIPDCPISLREVFVTADQFVCRMVGPAGQLERYERTLAAAEIAQSFVRDVVLHRLT